MSQPSKFRTYVQRECIVFCKTNEDFGGLSNMCGGFPIIINDIDIRTSEALYQACRFPHRPDLQAQIIDQRSPMSAKMTAEPHKEDSRPDWLSASINIMRWSLRIKLVQNWDKFSEILLSTRDKPIVELSYKSDFWGAKPNSKGELVGMNVLGRLLMELRGQLEADSDLLRRIEPMTIPDFLLYGKAIPAIEAIPEGKEIDSLWLLAHEQGSVKPVINEVQLSLFDELADEDSFTSSPTVNFIDAPRLASVDRAAVVVANDDIVDARIDTAKAQNNVQAEALADLSIIAPTEYAIVDVDSETAIVEVIAVEQCVIVGQSLAISGTKSQSARDIQGNTWSDMIALMGVSGLVKELAMHCLLTGINDEECALSISQKDRNLYSSRTKNLLQKAIQAHCQSEAVLVMTIEQGVVAAPAEKTLTDYQSRQDKAISSAMNDPNILALKQCFDARIMPGTIEPVTGEAADYDDSLSMRASN